MNRRSFLKHSIIGGGVLVFTPAQIFADKLFYTEDVENIINLTPYGPIEVGNILNFFTKVVNAIRAFKKGYDIFIDEYGRLNEQYYYRGMGTTV